MAATANVTNNSVQFQDNIFMDGIWRIKEPEIADFFHFKFTLMIFQNLLILSTTRSVAYLLKPFNQPRIVAELIGAILLSPTIIGKLDFRSSPTQSVESLYDFIFPPTTFSMVEIFGFLGLIYYVFLVAVRLDAKVVRERSKKVLPVAAATVGLPFLAVVIAIVIFGLSAPMVGKSSSVSPAEKASFTLILGFALSVPAFPVMARLLAEVKVPNGEVGQVVLPAAVVGDVASWVVLAVCFALDRPANEALAPMWMVLAGACHVVVCVWMIRPLLVWLGRKALEAETVTIEFMGLVAGFVPVAALSASAIGFHPALGALVLGLAVPKGQLTAALTQRLENFVIIALLPFTIISSAHATDILEVFTQEEGEPGHYVLRLACVVMVATLAKMAAGMMVSPLFSLPRAEGLSIGVLMNTIGPLELIILNTGKDRKIFNNRMHAVLLVASVISTAMVRPILTALEARKLRRAPAPAYKNRNLQLSGFESDLRVVACVHTFRNVPSITSLLYLANHFPISVCAVHLAELIGSAPPMLIVHDAVDGQRTIPIDDIHTTTSSAPDNPVESQLITSAFDRYQQRSTNVTVSSLTAVSAYASMPEDVFRIAEGYRATLIILPFHRLLTVDGEMEDMNPHVRVVNQGILADAPCSVAILVDRGQLVDHDSKFANYHVALLFFGGPNDREALLYASRFAKRPGVHLTVVRFVAADQSQAANATPGLSAARVEQRIDDEYVREFRQLFLSHASVAYEEKAVRDCAEMVTAIREMGGAYNLYIVGREAGDSTSALLASLSNFVEFKELGPIGDLLVSSEFSATSSVLVVQQYLRDQQSRWDMEEDSSRRARMTRRDGYNSIHR
ncbi:cation/H(+) antiporter 15-like [Curcuma longa]|uniref:cation/H(+) antiporter 15-like n=1 Tax=Curcuma longa TaxID=136217 RepID=UPI003D9F935B